MADPGHEVIMLSCAHDGRTGTKSFPEVSQLIQLSQRLLVIVCKNAGGVHEEIGVSGAEAGALRPSHGMASDKADPMLLHEFTEGLVGLDLDAAYIGYAGSWLEAVLHQFFSEAFQGPNWHGKNDQVGVPDC